MNKERWKKWLFPIFNGAAMPKKSPFDWNCAATFEIRNFSSLHPFGVRFKCVWQHKNRRKKNYLVQLESSKWAAKNWVFDFVDWIDDLRCRRTKGSWFLCCQMWIYRSSYRLCLLFNVRRILAFLNCKIIQPEQWLNPENESER